MDAELDSNWLLNVGEIHVKSEVLGFVDAEDEDVMMDEDSNYDLIPTTDSTDTASYSGGGAEMDPKYDDDSARLVQDCLSLNKRLVVELIRLPEPAEVYAREKTLIKMTNKTNQVGPQKGRQSKRSRVKNQKLPNVVNKTTKMANRHADVDQLIKDCHDNSKRLVVVLERISIHHQVQNNDVKAKRLKLCNTEDKYRLKSTLQAQVDNADKKIICVFCQTEFKDYSSRRTHYENDHKSRWNCKFPNCTESFSCESKNLYVFHQLTHEVKDFKYFWDKKMCPICKEQYDDRKLKEFRKHIISHQDQILLPSSSLSKKSQLNDQFNCETPSKSFAKKPNLNRHKQLVHTKRPTPAPTRVKCTECDKYLRSKSSLQDHQENFHQIFKCPSDNCTMTFEGKIKYDQHLIREHENDTNIIERQILSCDLCAKYKTFKKDDLRRHKLGVHSCSSTTTSTSIKIQSKEGQKVTNTSSKSKEKELLVCDLCDTFKTFKKERFTRHQRDVHSTTDDFVQCTLCGKTFKNNYRLKGHVARYHQPFKCTVGDCNSTFKTQGILDDHIKKHTCEKYICHLCSAQVPNISAYINNHMKTNHSVFTCTLDNCNGEFHTEIRMLVHQQEVHDPELRPGHLCPTCGLSYWTKKSLDRHRLDHNNGKIKKIQSLQYHYRAINKKPFVNRECRFCEKVFRSRDSRAALIRHEKSHEKILKMQKDLEESSGVQFPCSFCDRIYTKKKSLIYHTEMEHTKKPVFKCDFEDCDKIFKTNRQLNDHMDSKHLKIKINCTFCTEIFPTNSALSSHLLKVHKNERDYPFKCDVAGCSENFYRNKYLQDHIDQVHTNCVKNKK